MSAINQELALFAPAPMERAVHEVLFVEKRPVEQISKTGPIAFQVGETSSDYILLYKTKLAVKVRLLKEDNTPVDPTDEVALVNLSLHSLFRQMDVALQQQVVTPTVGTNYPYKAMFDVLLSYGTDSIESQSQADGFYKDMANSFDNPQGNSGHILRAQLTKFGFEADFEGPLHMDIAQQPKAILNGVPVTIKLFQHDDSFRLMSHGTKYQVQITDALLKVCYLKVNPSVVLAHNEQLTKSPAVYPFYKSNIKTYGISSGSLAFTQDDIFHGLVPNKLIVAFTSSAAYSGDFTRSPFNFQHFKLNYLELAVDGHSIPSVPFQPKYAEHTYDDEGQDVTVNLKTGYIREYLSLYKNSYLQNSGNSITRSDYPYGYAIYVFDIKPGTNKEVLSAIGKGQTRLSARFDSALSEPITAIVYGRFPSELKIDQARNVIL